MFTQKSQININERYEWGHDIPLRTPFVIYLEPCGYCNLKCKFCPYALQSNEIQKDIMSLDLCCKIMEDIQEFPDKLKMLRVCGNGETLMNKNILDILRHAYYKNIANKIQLVTNGTLLTQEIINEAPKYVDMIVVSIEGLSRQAYLDIANTNIDYNSFTQNIQSLYKSCDNHNCILHLKINDLAVADEKDRQLFFKTFGPICHEINIEHVVPLFPDMEYYSNKDSFRFDDGKKVVKRTVCPQIFKSLQVSANGDVVPCCVDWKRINFLGNVHATSLMEIWNGPEIRRLQNSHLSGDRFNLPLCQNCVMNEYSEVDNIDHMKGTKI